MYVLMPRLRALQVAFTSWSSSFRTSIRCPRRRCFRRLLSLFVTCHADTALTLHQVRFLTKIYHPNIDKVRYRRRGPALCIVLTELRHRSLDGYASTF